MNKLLIVAVILGVAAVNAAVFQEEEYQFLFSKFMTQYEKKYAHEQFFYRYTVFKVRSHQSSPPPLPFAPAFPRSPALPFG
jgi:hypothetical protein